MFDMQPSIRRKIKFGYYAILAMVIGLSVVTLAEIDFIKQKMIFGTGVHEFLDGILEMRRFEKNYLLYEQEDDYRNNTKYNDQAADLLTIKSERFDAIASRDEIQGLQMLLRQYQEFMNEHFTLISHPSFRLNGHGGSRKSMLEFRIRSFGDTILAAAFDIEKGYRKGMIDAGDAIMRIILIFIAALSLMAILAGRVLSRIVLQPLQRIEHTMEEIAEGQFVRIRIDSRDREIVSLTQAFNRMIRELELRQRHLIQSEKLASLGTLLSGVAHELNNPLWNISSSNQILLEKGESGTDEFRKHHLTQIEEQTDRARDIVKSLLDFSRNDHFKKQALPLRELLEETIRLMRGQLRPGIAIQLQVPADLFITADKQRMQQVFINLLKNSTDAIGEEGTISIAASKQLAVDKADDDSAVVNYLKYRGKCTLEEDTVDIQIHDTGPGIPPELLSKIFDPFFTTKDVGKGSGLGLFIVHEIIEEHDGCIGVDSAPDKGTTFLIRLPMK